MSLQRHSRCTSALHPKPPKARVRIGEVNDPADGSADRSLELARRIDALERELSEERDARRAMETAIARQNAQILDLSRAVRSILSSRIWRTLQYTGGGLLLAQARIWQAVRSCGSILRKSQPRVAASQDLPSATPRISVLMPGVASPSGRVQFLDGLSVIGTGTPSSGAATFNFASLAMGSHQIAAFYSGDNNWYAVKSAYIAVTVNRAATTTVLSVAPALTQATLTATVTVMPPGSRTLAGSVQFMDTATNTAFGTVQFSEKTMARISIDASQAVAMAGHPIRAVFSGSADCASSTANPMASRPSSAPPARRLPTWLRIGW